MSTRVNRPRLARGTTRVLVGSTAAVVLIVGFLLRPATPLPVSAIEERSAPILEEVVSRREAMTLVKRLQNVAAQNARFSARIDAPTPPLERWPDSDLSDQRPERYASIVDARRLIGRADDLLEGTRVDVVLGDGQRLTGSIGRRLGAAGLAVIHVEAKELLPHPPKAPGVAPGDAVVATAPGVKSPLVVPLFVAGLDEAAVRLTTSADRYVGMPVFHQDGGLIGIIAPGPAGARVLPVEAALATDPEPSPPSAGLGLTMEMQRTPSGETVIAITDVARDGIAARAGLRSGDMLVAIDGEPVGTLEDVVPKLTAAATNERAVRVRVRRGRRVVDRRLPALTSAGR